MTSIYDSDLTISARDKDTVQFLRERFSQELGIGKEFTPLIL